MKKFGTKSTKSSEQISTGDTSSLLTFQNADAQ